MESSFSCSATSGESFQEDSKTTFPGDGSTGISSYRKIPLCKTLEGMKVTSIRSHNISGMREITRTRLPRKTLDSNEAVGASERSVQASPRNSRLKKDTQNSLSAPNLVNIKGRGDATTCDGYPRHESSAGGSEFGDAQATSAKDEDSDCGNADPTEEELTGCVIIKDGDRIYRSVILPGYIAPQKRSVPRSPNDSKGNTSGAKKFSTTAMEFAKQACGDFDIAIFLKGAGTSKSDSSKKNRRSEEPSRTRHRMKPVANKRAMPVSGKNLEPSQIKRAVDGHNFNTNHPYKDNLYKKNHQLTNTTSSRYRTANCGFQRRNSELGISSASESESLKVTPIAIQKFLRKVTPDSRNNRIPRDGHRWCDRRSDSYSNKSTDASLMSLFRECKMPSKIADEKLFDLFENIFRRYASTSRHAGDVIPKRISTTWMVNAGVVDVYLSRKQADDAFSGAAAAKITMNSHEYKEFLIKLTQRLKLPYYEIYRRMCGIES